MFRPTTAHVCAFRESWKMVIRPCIPWTTISVSPIKERGGGSRFALPRHSQALADTPRQYSNMTDAEIICARHHRRGRLRHHHHLLLHRGRLR
jgi:hypothetical protein